MFENKKFNDIHTTRYIVSWLKGGGKLHYGADLADFDDWLKSLGLNDDERNYILEVATCGKIELENDARQFIKQHGKQEKEIQ